MVTKIWPRMEFELIRKIWKLARMATEPRLHTNLVLASTGQSRLRTAALAAKEDSLFEYIKVLEQQKLLARGKEVMHEECQLLKVCQCADSNVKIFHVFGLQFKPLQIFCFQSSKRDVQSSK